MPRRPQTRKRSRETRKPVRLPEVVKREEWDQIIAAAGLKRRWDVLGVRDKAILAVLFFSVIRSFELCDLDVRDLDEGEEQLHIRRGKGGKERYVYLAPLALECVREYLQVRPQPRGCEGDPLFVSRKGGRLSTRQIRELVERAGREAGHGDRVHPHGCRHSGITHLVKLAETPADLMDIQAQAGHADLATTQRYTHLGSQNRKRLAREM